MSQLYEIRHFIQKAALAATSVLGIEVQFVDENLQLIAGTGAYADRLYEYVDVSSASNYVIKYNKPIIIEHAQKHVICLQCVLRSRCDDLAEICYPISMGTKCLGLIGLTAHTEEQRQRLLSNMDNFNAYVESMAVMIINVVKALELDQQISLLINDQKTILNYIQEGIIFIDDQNNIVYANQSAAVLLDICQEDLLLRSIDQIFQLSPDLFTDVQLGAGLNTELSPFPEISSKRFVSTLSGINLPNNKKGILLCFKDIEAIPRVLQNFSSKERKLLFDDILGISPTLIHIKKRAFEAARGNSSILITGESGTGKEMFARAIHYASPRASGPFICINCSAIPETILESELFGYEEGSFTGARKGGKLGLFELADNGTLFLDEIGDMPLQLQVKLLRALEEKQIQRIGGIKLTNLNIRVVSATNKNLAELVKAGQFRSDLYFRINVIPIMIPPLRERPEDIKIYVDFFIRRYNRVLGNDVMSVSAEALSALLKYAWPGNIRELENVIEYAINFETENQINLSSLPEYLISTAERSESPGLQNSEKKLIIHALHKFAAAPKQIDKAADLLGISRATLYRKIKKYNIKQIDQGC